MSPRTTRDPTKRPSRFVKDVSQSEGRQITRASMDLEAEILTMKESAAFLHLSYEKVRQLTYNRKIPHFRVGFEIRYKKELLIEWIKYLQELKVFVDMRMRRNRVVPDLVEP